MTRVIICHGRRGDGEAAVRAFRYLEQKGGHLTPSLISVYATIEACTAAENEVSIPSAAYSGIESPHIRFFKLLLLLIPVSVQLRCNNIHCIPSPLNSSSLSPSLKTPNTLSLFMWLRYWLIRFSGKVFSRALYV